MVLKSAIQSALSHPLTRGLDLDSPETTRLRFRLIKEKSFLRQFYQDCYASIADSLAAAIDGPILELGSGGGFIKEQIPHCITSEILQVRGVDLVLDGQQLPIAEATLAGIVMLDVFHHIPRATFFFQEAARCVKPGGRVVMFEPWNTRWSRFVYRHLHHEPFDPDCPDWDLPVGGPMSGANSALPWMVFERDRQQFESLFPGWEIERIELQFPFCYLLSGGVAYRSLVPGRLYRFCKQLEMILHPWLESWAMFAVVALIRRKRS
jgi:SAM-dependent methyltransferase